MYCMPQGYASYFNIFTGIGNIHVTKKYALSNTCRLFMALKGQKSYIFDAFIWMALITICVFGWRLSSVSYSLGTKIFSKKKKNYNSDQLYLPTNATFP